MRLPGLLRKAGALLPQGASARALAAAEACYANDFGCGLAQLGLRELITENRAWDAGASLALVGDRLQIHASWWVSKQLQTSCVKAAPTDDQNQGLGGDVERELAMWSVNDVEREL